MPESRNFVNFDDSVKEDFLKVPAILSEILSHSHTIHKEKKEIKNEPRQPVSNKNGAVKDNLNKKELERNNIRGQWIYEKLNQYSANKLCNNCQVQKAKINIRIEKMSDQEIIEADKIFLIFPCYVCKKSFQHN